MRDYENSDTSSFNTYRSGNENPRRENSARSEWGSPSSVTRRGSTFGTADHYQKNTPGYQSQDYRDQRSQSSYRNQSGDWNQQHDRNAYGGNRSQDFRSQDRWPQDNRQQHSHYGNHSQDRDWDSHRSGDRRYFENRDRNQSWNRWNEGQHREDQDDYRSYSERNRSSSPRGYSADYGHQNPSNQGRGYDENRYQNRRSDQDYHREDEGFFDRMGNSIRNAWNRFTEEDREDQDRANRYEDRYRDSRRSSRRDSDNDGPPYSWGSSSSEDYRW
ncbi:MAG: hypothetical protein ACO1O1_11630 [Adhaeribacter sp.]